MTTFNNDSSPRPSDRHRVRQEIQSLILSGDVKPGSKLLQVELAKRFGVTQNVVREALLELQFSGLVEARDNKGIFVGNLTPHKFLEYLDVRAALEGLVASLCCDHISRAEVRELKDIAAEIKIAARENRVDDDVALDKKFHQTLLKIAQNTVITQIIEAYWPLMKIFSAKIDPNIVFQEHMAILDAMEQGQRSQAESRMREHILNSKRLIEQRIRDNQFEPQWLKEKL
jgi:DNA-binding GntR family transcriptional regulator